MADRICVRLHLRGIAENAKKEYNSLSQLVGDYQEHATVVNVGTSPKVGYRYDRLHRLVDFDRGTLTREDDLIDPMVRKAQWTLDATGNWSRFRWFDQSDSTIALDQTRTHNGVNEVTGIGETVGRVWVSPTHDRAGNMQIIPRSSDPRESYTATYDAWHRLVKVEQSDGDDGLETVAEYAYDGRNYRIVKRTYTAGELDTTRHFYYSAQWQVLEERIDASEAAVCQYVWGRRYIDDLVLRDRDTTSDGTLDERFYALQDANWNVIAISNPDCQIQERYAYDAYGALAVHNGAFTPIPASAYAWPYTYTGRRFDEETGLMHYRSRMYHAELGRFTGRDPIAYKGGHNLYDYVRSRPLIAIDPSGARIYLRIGNDTGNVFNDTFHMQVCVDDWGIDFTQPFPDDVPTAFDTETEHQVCFSFGVDDMHYFLDYPQQHHWLKWKLDLPAACALTGIIYEVESSRQDVGRVLKKKETTHMEDAKWLRYMRTQRVGTTDRYTLMNLNCAYFSTITYLSAPAEKP